MTFEARETILLVEDEKSVRELVHRVLDCQGYRVTAATSGEQAPPDRPTRSRSRLTCCSPMR